MVIFVDPAALEAVPDTVGMVVLWVVLVLWVALDDVALDGVLEDLLSLEQPATPATTIVAAPMAINNSPFTDFSFVLWPATPAAGRPRTQQTSIRVTWSVAAAMMAVWFSDKTVHKAAVSTRPN
jgi:hypothetical protein